MKGPAPGGPSRREAARLLLWRPVLGVAIAGGARLTPLGTRGLSLAGLVGLSLGPDEARAAVSRAVGLLVRS